MNDSDGIFYHVHRGNVLGPGQILNLEPAVYSSKHIPAVRSMVQKLNPRGLSLHGQQYMLGNDLLIERWIAPTVIDPNSRAVIQTGRAYQEVVPHYSTANDLVLELIRRCEFPEMPSRFESFSAWKDEETTRRFVEDFKVNSGRIFTVRGVSKFRGDMSWTKLGHSGAEAWYNAQRYWAGAARDDRLWEHLLSFPVEVLAEVK